MNINLASYTNKDSDTVEVSKEHLDIAIKIYEELRKSSASQKVSWFKHRKMMEKEGFYDSENSENYRQLIKNERRRRGVLPDVAKHAELLADDKLKAIKEEIGEISYAKRDAQNSFRELNKLKRELTDDVLLIERVENAISKMNFDFVRKNKVNDNKYDYSNTEMIIGFSDLHFGSLVDVEGHKYDTKIADELVMSYADKIIDIAKKENIRKAIVVNLGDLIENLYMRTQNLYSAERNLSEQIVDASELVIKFLIKLSEHIHIRYTAIAGNHDRSQGNKNESIFGDSAIVVSNKIISTFIKYSGANIEFVETDVYHYIHRVNNRKLLFVHGDRVPLNKSSLLAEQSMLYGEDFDMIISGHVHHFRMIEVSANKYQVTFGSIKGSDEYTLKTLNTNASRSQGIILISESGDIEVRKINL